MCLECYESFFAGLPAHRREPPAMRPEMAELAALIRANDKEFGLTYGRLHIVIGDWNLETRHIRWCLDDTMEHAEPLTELEQQIGAALLGLTLPERYAVMREAETHRAAGA